MSIMQEGEPTPMSANTRIHKLVLLCVIIALGAFLRLHQLDILPPGDSHDPAQYGVDALQILDGARPVYLPENYGREAMFSYIVALIYYFMGPS
ncbi:MAG: hypothetical protein KDE51_16175, partial [Anaerolineales bacterium]|nr:hypothetical protein [Anaerolineales bacterium]